MGAGASSQYRAGDANHRPPSFAEAVATKRRTTPNINVVVDGMNVVRGIEKLGSSSGKTRAKVVVEDCGEL